MLFGHDLNDPIGTWDVASEKSDGLHLTGKMLVDDVPRARQVHALVKSGAVRGVSIGFITKSARSRPGGGRTIKSLELLEASLVTIPMHPGAKVTSAKSAVQALALTRSELEILDDTVNGARQRVIDFAAEITMLQNMRDFAPHLPGEIEKLIDKLLLGDETADDTRLALVALGQANPDFSALIGQLSGLVGQMQTVTTTANEMYAAINSAGGPTGEGAGRGGAGASRRALSEKQTVGADYISEQERLLTLSRDQLAVPAGPAQQGEAETMQAMRRNVPD